MKFRSAIRYTTLVATAVLALAPPGVWAQSVKGTVTDGGKNPVGNATVYLVPAADVAKLGKAPSFNIRRNVADDEPMEDSLANNRDKYPRGAVSYTHLTLPTNREV